VDRRDRTLLDDPSKEGFVRSVELGWHIRKRNVDETVRPCSSKRITQSPSLSSK
jgi:hypothetical protein